MEPTKPEPVVELASLEHDVEQRSAVFKKELGLFDLVLTQVVFVVGTIWVGTAAKLGTQQLVFWLLAIVAFYLPLAAAGPNSLSTISWLLWWRGTFGYLEYLFSLESAWWSPPTFPMQLARMRHGCAEVDG
jgi:hypothetical protein